MSEVDQVIPLVVRARITVHKYLGDPPGPGEVKAPIETIVIEDGVAIEHTIHSQEGSDGTDQRGA